MTSGLLHPIYEVDRNRLREAADEFTSATDRRSFLAADPAGLASVEAFEELRDRWRRDEQPDDPARPSHLVPSTRLVLLDAGRAVAKVDLRHWLTDALRTFGGHIGYMVVPSARGRGLGSRAFELTLPVARRLGLSTVLVTCHHENEASRRIIMRAGGVLVDQYGDRLRFVVSTDSRAPETDIDALH